MSPIGGHLFSVRVDLTVNISLCGQNYSYGLKKMLVYKSKHPTAQLADHERRICYTLILSESISRGERVIICMNVSEDVRQSVHPRRFIPVKKIQNGTESAFSLDENKGHFPP